MRFKRTLYIAVIWPLVISCFLVGRHNLSADSSIPEQLPATELFQRSTHEEIVESQFAELENYFNSEIRRQRKEFEEKWLQGAVSPTLIHSLVQSKRLRLLEMIGAQVERNPITKVREKTVGAEDKYWVKTAEWTAFTLDGQSNPITVWCIVLIPKREGPLPAIVALPDAMETPDMISGLSVSTFSNHQFAKRLAENGYVALVPLLILRENFSGVSSSPPVDDRQWLFSLGFQVGQHVIGAEVLKVLSCIDYLQQLKVVDASRIGLYGAGQGGLSALYSAASDERIRAVAVLDHFGNPDPFYKKVVDSDRWGVPSFMIPMDQTVWGIEKEFGHAEIASLVAPRHLIIASSRQENNNRLRQIESELKTAREFYQRLGSTVQIERITLSPSENSGGPHQAILQALNRDFQPAKSVILEGKSGHCRISQADMDRVRNAQFRQLEQAYSILVANSYGERKKRWSQVNQSSLEHYYASTEAKLNAYFDFIGRYPAPSMPLRAFSKRIAEYETEKFSGYHLSVEVYPGVSAYGILLLPKGLKAGERRPVVITQHGMNGGPQYAIGLTDASQDQYYHRFGKRLAEQGYVVFAPMICTQDKRRYELAQKAALLGKTIVGLELRKISRVIDFLGTVPSVNSSLMAFYGLSWGGFTSIWLSPGEPRLTAVITSGHFNDWSVKTTSSYLATSYLRHGCALDFYVFDVLNHFDHSDLASLIAPRPYFIEIGDQDSVNVRPYRLIEMEMEEVASVYKALGIRERFTKGEFQGPHTIHGVESFSFLAHWLKKDW